MATPGRTEGASVSAQTLANDEVAELLEREPYLFDFFQAVRLLERYSAGGKPVGRFVKPSREVARFGAHPSLVFPASEIQSIQRRPGQPPFVEVNFMGLSGPLGVLPRMHRAVAGPHSPERHRPPRFSGPVSPPHHFPLLPGLGEIPLHNRL